MTVPPRPVLALALLLAVLAAVALAPLAAAAPGAPPAVSRPAQAQGPQAAATSNTCPSTLDLRGVVNTPAPPTIDLHFSGSTTCTDPLTAVFGVAWIVPTQTMGPVFGAYGGGTSAGVDVGVPPGTYTLAYMVLLVAPPGQIWGAGPANCQGYNTDRLTCVYTLPRTF